MKTLTPAEVPQQLTPALRLAQASSPPHGQTPHPRRPPARRRGRHLRRQERRAARALRRAADGRAGACCSNVPRLHDVATMLKLLRQHGRGRRARSGEAEATVSLDASKRDVARGALRAGQDDARVDPGARAAAGALRRGAGVAAGRLRHRHRGRSTSTSRACRRWAPRSPSSTATSSPRAARLKGARITTDMVTVTGTENLLMAATLAEGETVLENAAQEPEIPDLAEMLIAMGAQHRGPRHEPHPHRGRRASCTASRTAPIARPHRGRHLPVRRRRGGRRGAAARRARRPPRGGDREAARGRRDDRGGRRTGSASAPTAGRGR